MDGEDLSKQAQDDFVAARQADPKVNPDDLSRWLTCARLLAASALAPAVGMEHYNEARRLDAARVARIRGREVAI